METSTAVLKSLALIERAPIAMVGSVNTEGFPNIKAMLNLAHTNLGNRPQGVDDPDYCVLQFCAIQGNYPLSLREGAFQYHGMTNVDFEIPEEVRNA